MAGFDSKLSGQRVVDAVEKVEGLAEVATSGSYNDLSDKPTIPTEQVNADWNATSGKAQILNKPTIPAAVTVDTALSTTSTNPVQNKAVAAGVNAKYTKPSAGIPKSDLAAAVQTSLGKADTALQTEQYKGTVTGVKINGSTKNPSSGVVDLGTVITSHQDISGKQDKLVSGTNIKTINGTSILGEGDIAVGADDSGKLDFVYVTPVISGSTATYTIPAGVVAFCNSPAASITSVVLNFDCSSFSVGELYQFHIFVNDISSASLSIGWQGAVSSLINWPNGSAPTLEASYTILELSLLGGLSFMDNMDNGSYLFLVYGAWNRLSSIPL